MSYPTLAQIEEPTFKYVPPKEPVNSTFEPGGEGYYLTNQGNTLAQLHNTSNPFDVNTLGKYVTYDNALNQQIYKNMQLQNKYMQNQIDQSNSFTNKYLKPTLQGANTVATLGNLWLGFKNYGIAKKQLGLAKEQWNQTKEELNRIKTLRTQLTNSYMNGE